MHFWQTILDQAASGNFSFFILAVGVIQTILMARKRRRSGDE